MARALFVAAACAVVLSGPGVPGGPVAFASPIVGTSANTLPQGKFMIDLWAAYQSYDREYSYDLHGEGDEGWIDLPDNVTSTTASFVPRLLYGVTDWLTLRIAVPLEDRYKDFPDAEGQDMSTGLGDVIFDPKVLMYESPSGSTKASFLCGVRFPTGDTESEVPLSDGSTDFVAGIALSQKAGDVGVHLCSVYWVNGEAESGVDVRDQSITTLTLEDPLTEDWSLLWEAKATLGQDPSKFYRVSACPGVSWNASERFTIGLSALFSVAAKGCPAITTYDSSWAPFLRVYYRFY